MKLKTLLVAVAVFMSTAAIAAPSGKKSDPGYGDGGTAKARQIDACVTANTSTVISYDNGSHVVPCVGGEKYSGPLPEQKFPAPFR